MSILLFSDLHAGDSKSKHLELYNFLQIQSDVNTLFILGDLFDLWVTSAGRSLKEIQYFLDFLLERFGSNIMYLPGNHDEDFKYIKSINNITIKQFHTIKVNNKSIMCCHGHQYDSSFYLKKMDVVAKFNAWVVNKVDSWFEIDTRKWLVSLSDRIENDPYDKLIQTFYDTLFNEFHGVHDIVITGHTHRPCIIRREDLIMANTGDWMQNSHAIKITDNDLQLLCYEDAEIKVIKELGL